MARDSASRADGNFPSFQTEFCSFNLESTPGKPWTMDPADLLDVGPNMKWRLVSLQSQRDIGNDHRYADVLFSKSI